MKILIGILLFVAGLFAIILITAAFVKKDFGVERSIVINKPKSEVFNVIKSLKTQNSWSTWGKKDPKMVTEFVGTDGTVGCIHKWKGNEEVGSGEQEIKKIIEGERIETELRFKEPFESKSDAYFNTISEGESATKVTWGFSGKMSYPMNFMLLFMDMDKAIGKDYEESLSNLKAMMEK